MSLSINLGVTKWTSQDQDDFTKALAEVDCTWWVNDKTKQAYVGNFTMKDLIFITGQLWYFRQCFY